MASVLQHLVDTLNSFGHTSGSVFSSVITVNYYVGESIFSVVKFVYSLIFSAVCNLVTGLGIVLEDLLTFLVELVDTASSLLSFIGHGLDYILSGLVSFAAHLKTLCLGVATSVVNFLTAIHNSVYLLISNLGLFFQLLGSSLVLLVNLVPTTLYIIFTGFKSFAINFGSVSKSVLHQSVTALTTAPPELYLGILVGTVSSIVLARYSLRTIRERNITWETLATSLFRLICSLYVFLIRNIARAVGFCFTVVEVTVSNLRVPMFAQAGDSDDEDEDRENLVGDLEESDDEDREREARKKRNFDLLLQRRCNRQEGSRRGSTDSVEDMLLREVEREREDKLCVICVDKEKCIMILPCRHLCICESCQDPLKAHRNLCPICRKQIKQMIKAYL